MLRSQTHTSLVALMAASLIGGTAGPVFAAARPALPVVPPGRPPGPAVTVSPAPGATNVKPTQAVTWTWALPPLLPGPLAPLFGPPGPLGVPGGVVVVSNAQGSTLYSAASDTITVNRQAGTLTWTPPAVTADGMTTSVLGTDAVDSVAWVPGPLPGLWGPGRLTPAQQQQLRTTGMVTLPGVSLADLLGPAPMAPPHQIVGEVAQVQGSTITFVGGQTVTIPAGTRWVLAGWPGGPQAPLTDLTPGQIVRIQPPPTPPTPPARAQARVAGRRIAGPVTPLPAPWVIQVLPTPPGFQDTVFTTGSAVGEPVTWQAALASPDPSVMTGDTLTVTALDSYGDPATTGTFTVSASVAGVTVPSGTIQNGQGTVLVTDHTAGPVTLTVTTQGPNAADDQTLTVGPAVFQPGPPASMTLTLPASVTAGTTALISGLVTDSYGNRVNPNALDLTASSGSIQSPVTTSGGAYQSTFTAPTTLTEPEPGVGETVTVTGQSVSGTASAAGTLTVDPGAPAQITLSPVSPLLTGASATITGTVTDAYGNAVLNGTPVSASASTGTVRATATQGGAAQITYTAPATPGSATITVTAGSATAKEPVLVTAPIPAAATITLASPTVTASGTVVVSGTVTSASGPVAGALVTLTAQGGTLASADVVTNSQGAFTATVTPSSADTPVTVTAAGSTTSGGTVSGSAAIDPLVYGNQPWTDTGITVQAGEAVTVTATGSWASALEANLNGVAVPVGASGTFIAGASGTLELGPGATLESGTVDALITLTMPSNIVPTLDLATASPTVAPSGTAALTGQVMMGTMPVVDAPVTLAASSGRVSGTVTTTGSGTFAATWTAPASAGSATITATYTPVSGAAIDQTVTETVSAPTTATVDVLALSNGGTVQGGGGNGSWTDPDAAFEPNATSGAATPPVYGMTPTQLTLTRTLTAPVTLQQIVVTGTVSSYDNALNTSTDGFVVQGLENGQWVTLASYAPLTVESLPNGSYGFTRVITLSQPATVSAVQLTWPNAETSFTVDQVAGYVTPTVTSSVSGSVMPISGPPTAPIFASGTTLAAGWTESGPVYNYGAGTAGSNPADGGWANVVNGSVSYAFTVPTDSSATVTYAIPSGGYENGSSATIRVNGQTVATVSGTGVASGATPQATSPVTLWQETFGSGTYTVTISGAYINVYGLWVSNPSAVTSSTAPTASTMPGSAMPSGTVATATSQYANDGPANAIDGNLATIWSSAAYSGNLTLTFSSPIAVTSLGIAADGAPPTTEDYTVQGFANGQWTTIGSATPFIDSTATTVTYFTIPVTSGDYSALRFLITGNASWVNINEITLNPPLISGTDTLTT